MGEVIYRVEVAWMGLKSIFLSFVALTMVACANPSDAPDKVNPNLMGTPKIPPTAPRPPDQVDMTEGTGPEDQRTEILPPAPLEVTPVMDNWKMNRIRFEGNTTPDVIQDFTWMPEVDGTLHWGHSSLSYRKCKRPDQMPSMPEVSLVSDEGLEPWGGGSMDVRKGVPVILRTWIVNEGRCQRLRLKFGVLFQPKEEVPDPENPEPEVSEPSPPELVTPETAA